MPPPDSKEIDIATMAKGKIVDWKSDRGFGFARPRGGGPDGRQGALAEAEVDTLADPRGPTAKPPMRKHTSGASDRWSG